MPFPDYGQLAALEQGVVDAATGFVNNEPVRLELAGTPAVVLALPADAAAPGQRPHRRPGDARRPEGRRDPRASSPRRGGRWRRSPPTRRRASRRRSRACPSWPPTAPAQLAVLEATIDTWQNDYTAANGIGAVDPAAWERSIAFMSGLPDSPVAKPVTAADCIDATFAAP